MDVEGEGETFNQLCFRLSSGSAYAQDIYKFSRMAIDPQVSLTRYEVPRGETEYILCYNCH